MTGTVTDVKAYQWYAGGQWRDVTSGKLFDDFEPYTGNLYARVADCGAEEARLAISAAHEAFGVAQMHFNGVFAATADVKFVLSHAGGVAPYLARRFAIIDEMAVIADEDGRRGSAADTFRRLYWDTALAWSDPTLHTLRAVAGLDHVVYGSDYPYLRRDIAIRGRAELQNSPELSDIERAAVLHGAAVSLLPRLTTHPRLAADAATNGR
jgi:predicted TIM-barrel fold metal-dependent hydrolase